MKKSEVFQILYSTLDVFLKPHGFKLVKSRQGFIRYFKGGYHRIIIIVLDYHPEYWVNFTFGVRIDEVEKITTQFSELSPEGYKDSMTFHSSWGGIQGDNLFDYKGIYTEENTMNAALDIISSLRDIVLPYFEKYTDIKVMDMELNDHPLRKENKRFRAYPYHTAITLAKLTGRSDFEKLAQIYQKYLEESQDVTIKEEVLPKYYKLVEHLRTLDTAELSEQKSKKSGRTVKA